VSNWQRKVIAKILLLVARLFADEEWKTELKTLSNHISAREDSDV